MYGVLHNSVAADGVEKLQFSRELRNFRATVRFDFASHIPFASYWALCD